MGRRPGIGFRTDVKDEEFAEEIVDSVCEEFDAEKDGTRLKFEDWSISYGVLSGPNEYYGMNADSLVFSHRDDDWSEWDEFSSRGEKICEIADFVDEEFRFVTVEPVRPIVPFH